MPSDQPPPPPPSTATGPAVVLVVGRPASGKTTVSTAIADRWGLPVVSKDGLKELLFDTLGSGGREWSMALGRASFALLDYVVERQLQAGAAFVVDAAFNAAYEDAKFQSWQAEYGFTAIQVHCTASADELVRRFEERARDGSRHPGHGDHAWVEQFRESIDDDRREVLDLHGTVLPYESEAPGALESLLARLDRFLPAARALREDDVT
ncbi:AAA family ATPase [Leifsonia sp. NPDC056665]|uniref:AAA family ATPase n=1 Tax=Leifsonia sp. NPDC056665 TaxID=3345901 RepID=UPI0036B365CC